MSDEIDFSGEKTPEDLENELKEVLESQDISVAPTQTASVEAAPDATSQVISGGDLEDRQAAHMWATVRERQIQSQFSSSHVGSVSSQKPQRVAAFKAKILINGKNLSKQELLRQVSSKVQEHLLQLYQLREQGSDETAIAQTEERLLQAKKVRSYLQSSKQVRSVGAKVGIAALRCFVVVLKAPFRLLGFGRQGVSWADQRILESWRARETTSSAGVKNAYGKAVVKAHRELRKAAIDPELSLREVYASHTKDMSDVDRTKLDLLTTKHNSLLKVVLNSIKNKIRFLFGKEKKVLRTNQLVKSALDNKLIKLDDLHFIVDNRLFSHISPSILKKIDGSLLPEEEKKVIFKKLFTAAKTTNDFNVLVNYLKKTGRANTAKSVIKQELKDSANLSPDRHLNLQRQAASIGDSELLNLAFGIDLSQSNLSLPSDVSIANFTDEKGQTLLHYAMRSENGAFVKMVADAMPEDLKADVGHPFFIKDKKGQKPVYTMTRGLAEQLDQLYGLDGNRRGSFSSMAYYFVKIREQAISWSRKASLVWFHTFAASAGSIAMGCVPLAEATNLDAEVVYRMSEEHVMPAIDETTDSALRKMIGGFLKKCNRERLALHLGVNAEQVQRAGQDKLNAKRAKASSKPVAEQFRLAVKRRDVEEIVKLVQSHPDELPISTKIIKSVNRIRHFPNLLLGGERVDSREMVLNGLMSRIDKQKHFEMLFKEQAKMKDNAWIEKQFNLLRAKDDFSSPQDQTLIMLAARQGRVDILKTLPSDKISWLSWQNSEGDNLFHAAARSQDLETFIYIAEQTAREIAERSKLQKEPSESLKYQVQSSGSSGKVEEREVQRNVFNLRNGKGEKIQDLISSRFAMEVDEVMGMDSASPGSLFHLTKLRAKEKGWSNPVDADFGESASVALGVAGEHATSLLVKTVAVTATTHGGPVAGVLAAFATKLVTTIFTALTIGAIGKLISRKKTGEWLNKIETIKKGYVNEVKQIGVTMQESLKRLEVAGKIYTSQRKVLSTIGETLDEEQVRKALNEEQRQGIKEVISRELASSTTDPEQMMRHLAGRLSGTHLELSKMRAEVLRRAIINKLSFKQLIPPGFSFSG